VGLNLVQGLPETGGILMEAGNAIVGERTPHRGRALTPAPLLDWRVGVAIGLRIGDLEGGPEAAHDRVQVEVSETESCAVGCKRRHLGSGDRVIVTRCCPPTQRVIQVEDHRFDRHGLSLTGAPHPRAMSEERLAPLWVVCGWLTQVGADRQDLADMHEVMRGDARDGIA